MDVYLPVRITQVTTDPAPAIGAILGIAGVVTAVATLLSGRLADAQGGIRWLMPMPRNTATFAFPVLAAALAPFGVGLALVVGALAYALSALTGWLAHRETPGEMTRIRQEADEEAREGKTRSARAATPDEVAAPDLRGATLPRLRLLLQVRQIANQRLAAPPVLVESAPAAVNLAHLLARPLEPIARHIEQLLIERPDLLQEGAVLGAGFRGAVVGEHPDQARTLRIEPVETGEIFGAEGIRLTAQDGVKLLEDGSQWRALRRASRWHQTARETGAGAKAAARPCFCA